MSEVGDATKRRGRVKRSGRIRRVDRGKLARWGLSIALFFVLWEAIGRSHLIIAIVPASEVLPDLAHQIAEGGIIRATLGTLSIAGVGFAIGALLGVPMGVILGVSKRWSS